MRDTAETRIGAAVMSAEGQRVNPGSAAARPEGERGGAPVDLHIPDHSVGRPFLNRYQTGEAAVMSLVK